MLYTDNDEDDLTCSDLQCIRDIHNGFGWRDEGGYYRCNSWFCGYSTDNKKCYGLHSTLSHFLREFVGEYDWYTHISWSKLFDVICDDSEHKEDFCDCYYILSKAIDRLPNDAKDEEGNVFSGIPVCMTREYMDIKADYMKELSALTDLVENNSPDKVSFILSNQILANEIYIFQKYATLHYTPYSTSVVQHEATNEPPAKIKKEN